MATYTFLHEDDAGADIYFRVFDADGLVFDFNDDTFKALAGATTPYVAATERGDWDGTSKSGYTAEVDLARIAASLDLLQLWARPYDNAVPASTDVAVGASTPFLARFGEHGDKDFRVGCEVNVKSTQGNSAQVSCWLEHGGQKAAIATIGGTPFTADAGTDTLTATAHGLSNGDIVRVTSSGTLPAGLGIDTNYFVVSAAADTFQLSATSGGSAIDLTSNGTGRHKFHHLTGSVTLREHGSGVLLFTKSLTFADFELDTLEGEQTDPGFTDDRQYEVVATITKNGTSHSTSHRVVVIG